MAITNLDMVRALHQEMHASFNRVLATWPYAASGMETQRAPQWTAVMNNIWNWIMVNRRFIEGALFKIINRKFTAKNS
jgi:hypothetical protein